VGGTIIHEQNHLARNSLLPNAIGEHDPVTKEPRYVVLTVWAYMLLGVLAAVIDFYAGI
jgi:hypothetical protein